MAAPASLHGLNLVAALLRLLAEREPHESLLERARDVPRQELDSKAWGSLGAGAAMVRFEMAVLGRERLRARSRRLRRHRRVGRHLAYVSPRSSRAVSRVAGLPYRDRLLVLPAFLLADIDPSEMAELESGLHPRRLFLARDLFGPRWPRHARRAHRLRRADARAAPVRDCRLEKRRRIAFDAPRAETSRG